MQRTQTKPPAQQASAAAAPRARARAWPRISSTALFLTALILIGLALRLWFISVNDIDPRFSAADDGDYYQRALRLAATGEYLDNSWLIRPPGHVFFFAAMLRLAIILGDSTAGIAMIRGVQVALSLLLIPIGYDLARRLFSPRAGLIFATLLAVWFPLVELPALILSEPLFFSMLTIHCWLLVRWRDSRSGGSWRGYAWLAGSGVTLAIGALARSPALYASVFVLGFLLFETRVGQGDRGTGRQEDRGIWIVALGSWLRRFVVAALVFVIPFAAVIAPWTIRNYVTYHRLILIDTLGPVNLWMAQSDAVASGRGENEAKAILAGIPQEQRQDFVSAELARIMREDPWRFTRAFWPTFKHIWKAQFVEDYCVKVSFFTRPLDDIWPLGAFGDLLWIIFTTASLFTLFGRPREGAMRLIPLGWIAYTCLMVMLIHVEPRYLLPIWFFMCLYGAASLARLWDWISTGRVDRLAARAQVRGYLRSIWGLGAIALCAGYLYLVFTYRDYPHLIAVGIQRDIHWDAGKRAYAAGDYPTAIREFEAMLAAQPNFVDGRTDLARVYLDQGRYEEAWAAVGDRDTHRANVIRGALARAQGDYEQARLYLEDAEVRAGENVQKLTLEWLHPAHTNVLRLGDGLDFGYLDGFSFGEDLPPEPDGTIVSYRWLQGHGVIVLPLAEPLRVGSSVRLRLAGGLPGDTPLEISVGGKTTIIAVRGGEWRNYQLAVPESLAGQERIEIRLNAPTFIPVQLNPQSGDARLLSLMVSSIAVN